MAIVGGSAAFRSPQRALFEHLAGVRLASYELRAAWERYGDLAGPAECARHPGAQAIALPVTEERYRIAGYDRWRWVEDLYSTVGPGRDLALGGQRIVLKPEAFVGRS